MHKAHDLIGNSILLLLPVAAWLLGRALAANGGAHPTDPPPVDRDPTARLRRPPPGSRSSSGPAPCLGNACPISPRPWSSASSVSPPTTSGSPSSTSAIPRNRPRTSSPRPTPDNGIEKVETNPDVWSVLNPTSGGSYTAKPRRSANAGSTGRISLFHFFWKPAAANRWVTGHRPDVCMPAGGWKKDGEPEAIQVRIGDQDLDFTLFRFAGVNFRAVQIWGIWRNGQPIGMDFFSNPTLEWSLLTGKNRSAVEIVSCVVTYAGDQPPIDLAKQVLASAFAYGRTPTLPSLPQPTTSKP
jgi:hypothetical protein